MLALNSQPWRGGRAPRGRRSKRMTDLARFRASYTIEKNGCWLWRRSRCNWNGYPRDAWFDQRYIRPCVLAWNLFKSEPQVSTPRELVRLCTNGRCINPDHFKFVGRLEDPLKRVQSWTVDCNDTDKCWESRFSTLYVLVKGKLISRSRKTFELIKGPIPPGHFVLHRCKNSTCLNPAHLYLSLKKTRSYVELVGNELLCKYGHSLTPENIYLHIFQSGKQAVECKTCRRKAAQRSKAKGAFLKSKQQPQPILESCINPSNP